MATPNRCMDLIKPRLLLILAIEVRHRFSLYSQPDTKPTTGKLILLKIIRYHDESKVTDDTNIVAREFLTPYFMKTSCIAYSSFFKCCPTLHPTHPLANKLHLTVLFVALFLWLNGCLRNILGVILLTDITDLHVWSLGTLVPEGPHCVLLCNEVSSLLRSDT